MRLTRRRAALLVGPILAACASVARPPGGPTDTDPPRIVAISIDTNATGVTANRIEVEFDEVISERPTGVSGTGSGPVTLEAIVMVSPRTGTAKVEWHRDRLTISPRGGFKPNTSYRITLLAGISDIRGNVIEEATSFVFSTGPALLPFSILGRVFDWQAASIAPAAIVEAVANAGTEDSLIYIAVADSVAQFDLGPLAPGRYLVRGFIDADRNRERGVLEKWDSLTVTVTDFRPSVELRAIQRDTAPIGISQVEVMDSTWIRLTFDKPFDPRTDLLTGHVVLQRSDSSVIPVAAVMTVANAELLRPRPDSAARDSIRPQPIRMPVADSTRPPDPRPAIPPPERMIVVRLSPTAALRPGEKYRIAIRGIRNLVGRASESSFDFEAPRPAPTRPPPSGAAR